MTKPIDNRSMIEVLNDAIAEDLPLTQDKREAVESAWRDFLDGAGDMTANSCVGSMCAPLIEASVVAARWEADIEDADYCIAQMVTAASVMYFG